MYSKKLCEAKAIDKKKTRKRNTTDEQYETYLHKMETDFVFKSGIVNPTLDDDCMLKKWEDLTEKLNSSSGGPQLSVDEWKKRFNDWKNSTRAKYRKLKEKTIQTGGGPPPEDKLTNLEKRGLEVWGKVTVTGCPSVTVTGGLILTDPVIESSELLTIPNDTAELPEESTEFIFFDEIPEPCSTNSPNENVLQTPILKRCINNNNRKIKTKKGKYNSPPPLHEVAGNLLKTCEESNVNSSGILAAINTFSEMYKDIEERKLLLESRRLNFDIARYKYENTNFHFE